MKDWSADTQKSQTVISTRGFNLEENWAKDIKLEETGTRGLPTAMQAVENTRKNLKFSVTPTTGSHQL